MSRKPSRSRKIALRAPGWKELIILRLCASNNIMRLIIILFLSLVSSLSAERLIEDHFLISMQSQAMGTYTRIMDRDESTGEIETRVEMQIRIKRFKEPVVISRTSIVREDKSGRPIAFDIISNESQIPAKTHGMRVGDEFVGLKKPFEEKIECDKQSGCQKDLTKNIGGEKAESDNGRQNNCRKGQENSYQCGADVWTEG